MIRVTLMNHEGEGYAEPYEIAEGTQMDTFFRNQMGEQGARYINDYEIRVNREAVEAAHILREGDKIVITPTKMRGAIS